MDYQNTATECYLFHCPVICLIPIPFIMRRSRRFFFLLGIVLLCKILIVQPKEHTTVHMETSVIVDKSRVISVSKRWHLRQATFQ